MEVQIVQWIQCDDKIKEYNNKIKKVKEMKEKLGNNIMNDIDIQNKDKKSMPIFNVKALQASIVPQITNSYESYTSKFYKECFTEYLGSEEKADELIQFMKNKRKVEKKYSLKRETLIDLND
tara:strand:- start:1123 stop:1488 length:366 start_codon:yes stop_codon:yes gene_type:complete